MNDPRRTWRKIWIGAVVALAALSVALGAVRQAAARPDDAPAATPAPDDALSAPDIRPNEQIEDVGMIEDKTVYDNDDPDSVVCFYVTVRRGDAGSDTDHSFAQVNSAVRFVDDSHVANDVFAKAIVQVGDESGPLPGMLGYGVDKPNATIRVRGNSSSTMAQKSYKLSLDEEAGLWRGQSNIALNKHIFDATRIKNKLYFDLLRTVEAVPSLRTQFVHLYIKDETSGQTQYEDYGLYTQAEVPTKKYLGNHGLDREGYLYKAVSFNFEPSPALRDFDDPEFDAAAFESILGCKGRQDNTRLIELVERINDRAVDINTIVGEYIDRENYLTWLAYNILLGNTDTTMQNFYLYSPLNGQKWFFIPWDGDNILHTREDALEGTDATQGSWEHGVSNYWGVILHQRFLKNEANREELAAKVEELHATVLSAGNVTALAARYNEVAEPFVNAMPDLYYLGSTLDERRYLLSTLGQEIEDAYDAFYRSLHELMPFYMYPPVSSGEGVDFTWAEAYDFDSHPITYRLTVAPTPDLAAPVLDVDGLEQTEYLAPAGMLAPGTWYYRVTARTDDGRQAEAMNKILVGEVYYPGVDVTEVAP